MADFIIKNSDLFRNKKCLELGAGYSGLSGLVLGLLGSNVLITDGNEVCAATLTKIKELNSHVHSVATSCLRWQDPSFDQLFDVIIVSDW
jgi:predicted nicotinamide N-methyase